MARARRFPHSTNINFELVSRCVTRVSLDTGGGRGTTGASKIKATAWYKAVSTRTHRRREHINAKRGDLWKKSNSQHPNPLGLSSFWIQTPSVVTDKLFSKRTLKRKIYDIVLPRHSFKKTLLISSSVFSLLPNLSIFFVREESAKTICIFNTIFLINVDLTFFL